MERTEAKTKAALPGAATSLWLISRLFFRVGLGRKRSLWLGLLLLLPVLGAVYWWIAGTGTGTEFFRTVLVGVFLQFLALGLPLYLGVSAIRDEIEDKTIVYLFARPVPRAAVIGGKILSVALVVAAALAVSLVVFYLAAVSMDGPGALARNLGFLARAIGVLALAAFAYAALFSLFGVLMRKPMILALAIGFGWEGAASNFPAEFPRLTLMFYLKSLLGIGPDSYGLVALLLPPISPASVPGALAVLLVVTAALFAAALAIGSVREYRI